MGTIKFTKFREGDTPTAAELNQPYDDLAAITITELNTKPNWATRAHFNQSAGSTLANEVFFFDNPTTTGFTTQSTNYVLVNSGGTPSSLTINRTADATHLLRVQTSGIIGDVICNDDGDGTNATASYNCIGMRLVVYYNDGGGTLTETIAECGYSFNRRSRLTNDTTGLDTAIWWRNFSFSGVWRVGITGRTIEKVELQVKVGPNGGAGNQADITRNNITAILIKE
jgi:hypothetical protein